MIILHIVILIYCNIIAIRVFCPYRAALARCVLPKFLSKNEVGHLSRVLLVIYLLDNLSQKREPSGNNVSQLLLDSFDIWLTLSDQLRYEPSI